MKRLIVSFFLIILLAACGNPTPAAVSQVTAVPVEEKVVSNNPDTVIASAVVAPAKVTQLGFTISALVKEIPVKEGDKVQAGQTLMVLNTPELDFAVVAADAAFKNASINAELQDADRVLVQKPNTLKAFIYVALPYEVKFKAMAKADQLHAALEVAQATLAQGTLISPVDATVASIDVIPGELVQVDQAVITLATLDDLQIKTTDLSERDIAQVKIGQSVNVTIEALNVTVTGKVIRISPISEDVGGDVVFPVTVELNEQPDGLLWGMTAEVEIQTK